MGFNEKELDKEFKEARSHAVKKAIADPNAKNINLMKELEGIEPKYAKHMLHQNDLIKAFAMHMGGGIDLLNQPVCRSCERPASWNTGGSAYCFACNTTTQAKDVITVKKYLMEYTKAIDPQTLELLNELTKGEDKDNGIII